ncbi:MAG: adenylate/guanylate cyclase domain-containing protein [Myxococcales bacterium]|nr:adenylate/guanylate cyclase domain-containing protein [Myxococcales bacterium]
MGHTAVVANPIALGQVEPRLTIAELLRDHPWPGEHGRGRLEWLWAIDVDLAPAALWPLVSDVSRLNRALGNPEMEFFERDGVRHGRARYNGVPHEWHEVPWEWVAGRWFTFTRLFSRGGMRALHAIHRFERLGPDRTRLYVYFGVVPRSRWLSPVVRWSMASMGRKYRRVIPRLAHGPAGLALPEPLVARGAVRPEAAARLDALVAELRARPVPGPLVDHLAELVAHGDDLDVCRVQVRALARRWTVDEDELLRTCLHATRVGLLELVWDVVCPHCRGVRASAVELDRIPTDGTCQVCDVAFGTSEAVEVSFRAHPALRSVTPRTYCSAEPATKTHIRVQRALAPGADAAIAVELPPGRYRLRTLGERGLAGFLDVRPDAESGAGGRDGVTWRATTAVGEATAAATAELALVNDATTPRTFIVEGAGPAELALRPGKLFSMQEFRDLFSEAFLGADVQLAVGEQTILFTDIVGSTAMYAQRGDPAAFVTVRDHFRVLFELIGQHRGAVVKTIGDAAMGAFTDPADAVRCAEAIQRRFGADAPVRLRVAANTGACIAVRLNANLDYFGNAVNLAARLQGLVEAGQIVIAAATAAAPGVAELLSARRAETLTTTVRGIAGEVTVRRWRVE